jgi:hypothetical protein
MDRYKDKMPSYGDLMTVNDFRQDVRAGGFIDYDGFGHPAKLMVDNSTHIYPSQVDAIPDDATHIVWFNK